MAYENNPFPPFLYMYSVHLRFNNPGPPLITFKSLQPSHILLTPFFSWFHFMDDQVVTHFLVFIRGSFRCSRFHIDKDTEYVRADFFIG